MNKGEIPSTGSLVEVFNKGILERCLKSYNEGMSGMRLPISEESLHDSHEEARNVALKMFDQQHFGHHHAKKSVDKLDEEIEKVSCSKYLTFGISFSTRIFQNLQSLVEFSGATVKTKECII